MKLVATLLCLALSTFAGTPAGAEERAHCNLAVLTQADRERAHQVYPLLRDAIQERKELADGYAYRFPATALKEVGDWVAIEAKCCQPLSYEISVGPLPGGVVWVRITGHEAKEFIDAEFARISEKVATRGNAK